MISRELLILSTRRWKKEPDAAINHLNLAILQWHTDQPDKAFENLQKARSSDPRITDSDDLRYDCFWGEKALSIFQELQTYADTRH